MKASVAAMAVMLGAAPALSGPARAAASAPDSTADVTRVVQRFIAARSAFDPKALAETLAPDYEEISPIGDVDSRNDVLGFYAPAKRVATPAMSLTEQRVRTVGDSSLLTARVSWSAAAPDGSTAVRSVRVRYLARRTGEGWKLASVQYTPIRVAATQPPQSSSPAAGS